MGGFNGPGGGGKGVGVASPVATSRAVVATWDACTEALTEGPRGRGGHV